MVLRSGQFLCHFKNGLFFSLGDLNGFTYSYEGNSNLSKLIFSWEFCTKYIAIRESKRRSLHLLLRVHRLSQFQLSVCWPYNKQFNIYLHGSSKKKKRTSIVSSLTLFNIYYNLFSSPAPSSQIFSLWERPCSFSFNILLGGWIWRWKGRLDEKCKVHGRFSRLHTQTFLLLPVSL